MFTALLRPLTLGLQHLGQHSLQRVPTVFIDNDLSEKSTTSWVAASSSRLFGLMPVRSKTAKANVRSSLSLSWKRERANRYAVSAFNESTYRFDCFLHCLSLYVSVSVYCCDLLGGAPRSVPSLAYQEPLAYVRIPGFRSYPLGHPLLQPL